MNLGDVLSPDGKNGITDWLFTSDSVPSGPEKHWKLIQALGMLEEVYGLDPQGLFWPFPPPSPEPLFALFVSDRGKSKLISNPSLPVWTHA